jgi:hypothetical protein
MTARDLEVVQADREAAARIYSCFRDHDYASRIRNRTNAGGDHNTVIQTLARHRLAHQPPAACEGALEKVQRLIDCIKQTSANLWWVDADDPEAVACDASQAVSSLRDQIEADSKLEIAPDDKADLAAQMKQARESREDKSWSSQ